MGDPDGKMLLDTRNKFHHWNFWAVVSTHWYLCVSLGRRSLQCGTLSSSSLREPMRLSMVTMCFAHFLIYEMSLMTTRPLV